MFAEIITIGDELLIGQVVDTNSAWMGQRLNQIGIEVLRRVSVRDREDEIRDAISEAFRRSDIILLTGGLGPTKDDITKQVLCDFFHTRLVFDETVWENVQRLLAGRVALNALNRDQALMPESCTVIPNRVGTAAVSWFEHEGRILVSMPGVPQEMKVVMTESILPKLKERFSKNVLLHRTFLINRIPESVLAERLVNWESSLPQDLRLAYLPALGYMRLRLTARGSERKGLEDKLSEVSGRLLSLLDEDVVASEDIPLEICLARLLKARGASLSTAESCTGGAVAARIVAHPGASEFFKGSIVAYSCKAKEELLHVSSDILDREGVVSEATAVEMLRGTMAQFHTDCGIATTGFAGSEEFDDSAEVGKIWIAVGYKNEIRTYLQHIHRGREANIERTINNALLMLIDLLR